MSTVRVTQFPTTGIPDAPLVQDASYAGMNTADRAYIDGQIIGIQGVIAKGNNGNALFLQGVPISATPPTSGQLLAYNGAQWAPISGSGVTLAGDVTGTDAATVLSKIQGVTVDAATMGAAGDTNFIQKLAGSWKAITAVAAAVALFGASLTNAPPAANYIPVSASSSTATWTALSSITAGAVTPGTAGQTYITNGTPAAVWSSAITIDSSAYTASTVFQLANPAASIAQWFGGGNISTYRLGTQLAGAKVEIYADNIQKVWTYNTTASYLESGYVALNGSGVATYPTTGLIRNSDHGGTGVDIIGAEYSGVSYGALSQVGNTLYLGMRNDASHLFNSTYVAATTAVDIYVAGATQVYVLNGTTIYLGAYATTNTPLIYDYTTTTTPTLKSGGLVTQFTIGSSNTTTTSSMTISLAAMTADVVPGTLKVQGAYAYGSASGTHRVPGSILYDIGAPTNGGTTEAFHTWTRNASNVGQLGVYGAITSQAFFWVGTAAFTTANVTIMCDGSSFLYLNTPTATSALVVFAGNSPTLFALNPNTSIGYFGGSSGTAPVQVNWATTTTPLVQSGTSATSLTVGTSKAAATLSLAGDANVVGALIGNLNIQLCSGTSSWGSGSAVVGVTNATTAPTANPTGGGILYALSSGDSSGDPFWRDVNGCVMPMGWAQVAKSAAFTLGNGCFYWVDDSAGSFNIQLPAPVKGFLAYVWDKTGSFQANPVTFVRNGSEKINNSAANKTGNQNFHLYVIGSNGTDWVVV